ATKNRRPLGIGIINFAYWLAKNDFLYTDPKCLPEVDRWAQHWSYYLIKASADLAKEFGPCPYSHQTKYHQGLLPVDTYKTEVDELVKHKDAVDWPGLRKQLKEHGIRNSTLMAIMPAETSAQISNATNGVEPPRSYISVKQSKHGALKQVVPQYSRLKNKYELVSSTISTGGPSKYYKIIGTNTKVGFISPHSHNFCDQCNRVRLTAEGQLLLCLGQEHSVSLKKVIRSSPGDIEKLKYSIRNA
ncbi:uncharacterized protein METZ01_LOCUS475547, partial [marine metagenome]